MKLRTLKAAAAGVALALLLLAATPASAGSAGWTDPEGDATGLGLVDGGPNDPEFDVTKVSLEVAGDKLVWSALIPAMTSGQPTLSTGYYTRLRFTHEGVGYQFIVAEDVTGAKTFSMSETAAAGASLTDACKGCKGELNREATSLRVEAPIAGLNAAFASVKAPPVTGKAFSALEVLSQRRTGVATLTADTATAPTGTEITF